MGIEVQQAIQFLSSPALLITIGGIISISIVLSMRLRGNYGVKKYRNLPPGEVRGFPFIGDDTALFMRPHSPATLGQFLDQRISREGRIFKAKVFGKATIVSADPELNRFVLDREGRLFECSYPMSVKNIIGNSSMLAITGDAHARVRSIALNFLTAVLKRRPLFIAGIHRQAADIIAPWRENITFSAQDEANKFAFNLMVEYLMSMNKSMAETEELRREYATFMKGMVALPINFPGTAYRRALQSRSKIVKIIGARLDRAKRSGEEMREDLMAYVATKNSDLGRDLTVDLILSMLFAGHETTSALISLAIYFLQSCPQALRELREEHAEIAEAKKGEKTLNCWDDYKKKMDFTDCVINETLRLGNIVKFLHRKAIKDVHFKGYDIPRGWGVIPIVSAEHLDSSIYDDPQKFNPWRWQTKQGRMKKTKRMITSFGGGPRLCPGAELARLELAVLLHHLVLKYDWELAAADYPVSTPFLHFPNGLPIRVRSISAPA